MAGTPADRPAGRDRGHLLPPEHIAEKLGLLLTALSAFIFSSVLIPLQRLDRWWLVVAATFALGAVVAVLALLRALGPPRRLLWLAVGLTVCALGTLGAGFALRPDPVLYDRAATLLLVDTSQGMKDSMPDATTKLDAAIQSVRMHAVGAYEQLGLATYGVDDCGDRPPYHLRMKISAAGASRVDRAVEDLRAGGEPTSRSRPAGRLGSCNRSRVRTGAFCSSPAARTTAAAACARSFGPRARPTSR
jgi:hypothetical protein